MEHKSIIILLTIVMTIFVIILIKQDITIEKLRLLLKQKKTSGEEEPKYWTTLSGRKIPIEELTHQHLSNIYHHHMKIDPTLYQVRFAKEQIDKRFEGLILPYVKYIPDVKKSRRTSPKNNKTR